MIRMGWLIMITLWTLLGISLPFWNISTHYGLCSDRRVGDMCSVLPGGNQAALAFLVYIVITLVVADSRRGF